MNSIDHPAAQQGPPLDPLKLRADALSVVLGYLALMEAPIAFQLLEYLHSAASHVPDHADAYLVAADDLREMMGIDRTMGHREL